jgi:hypothetical protein
VKGRTFFSEDNEPTDFFVLSRFLGQQESFESAKSFRPLSPEGGGLCVPKSAAEQPRLNP